MRCSPSLAGLALVVFAGPLSAQYDVPEDAVIVTATRVPRTADETLASVTVITREDIERRQVRSLREALRSVPGLSITNSGGPGKASSVFLRGTESDHVLVLIDGVKVGSATTGTTAFQDIPVEQIERIEIVRGPRSSLYGSEAIGGVIQIFTRRGEGPITPSFSVSAGSHETYGATAGVSGGTDRTTFNASASVLDTEGIDACRDFAGCFAEEPDKDGYQNIAGSLRFGYQFGDNAEMNLHWLRAQGETEFDGSILNESEILQEAYGVRFRLAPADSWDIGLLAGRSGDEADNLKDGVFVNRFDTQRDVVSLQNDFFLGAGHIATVGFDHQNEEIESTTPFPVTSRDNSAVFAQYQAAAGAHRAELSARRDDNEQFGGHTTGGAAWGYEFAGGPRVRASFGTAFKAPTFNDLYFPGFGNPDLEPEESRSVELGVSDRARWGDWSLSLYQTEIDNLIGFDATFTAINVDRARIRGLEATHGARWRAWNVTTSLALLDPENRSPGANHGNLLPRRAEEALAVDIDRAFGRYRLGLALYAEGRRFDDLANERRLGGYALVDVRAQYALARHWRLQARLANLFDKDYETAMFFNQPGREFFLTLRYQPLAGSR